MLILKSGNHNRRINSASDKANRLKTCSYSLQQGFPYQVSVSTDANPLHDQHKPT